MLAGTALLVPMMFVAYKPLTDNAPYGVVQACSEASLPERLGRAWAAAVFD